MKDFLVSKDFSKLLKSVDFQHLKASLPALGVGDSIKVGLLIKEGNKERTQYFDGLIIAQKNVSINQSISVRRVLQGIGMEKTFMIHSPKVVSLQVKKSSRVRRSKLYYLRQLSGKASRLKQRFD